MPLIKIHLAATASAFMLAINRELNWEWRFATAAVDGMLPSYALVESGGYKPPLPVIF